MERVSSNLSRWVLYTFHNLFSIASIIINPGPTTCPDLTLPTNGVIIYSSSTSPHPQGTMATQICLNGYVPSTTGTAIRVCLSNGSWSESALTCQCKYTMYSDYHQAFCVQLGMVHTFEQTSPCFIYIWLQTFLKQQLIFDFVANPPC